MEKIIFGHTYMGESGEMLGLVNSDSYLKNDNKYYCVELNLMGGHLISEFFDLEAIIKYKKKHDLIYRFIENKNIETHNITALHQISGSNKIVGYHNYYGIGDNWKLFINSKDDIALQHNYLNISTIRFRNFNIENNFFICLACLIYTLTNFSYETETELKSAFNRVKNYAILMS